MKKLFLLATGLLFLNINVNAQQAEDEPVLYKSRKGNSAYSPFFDQPEQHSSKRLHTSLQAGTSVGTNFRNGTYWGNYIAPQLSYQVSPRWNLNVGTMVSYSRYNGLMRTAEGYNSTPVSSVQTFVYGQGQYQVSERLRLTGTAFYEMNRFDQLQMNPQATNFNTKGASMYADFKISEHFSVGAGVQISNGNNYLRNGLYNNSMFYPSTGRMNNFGVW
jgi:hypothetical protein